MQHRLTWKLAAGHRRFAAIALSALVALGVAGAPAVALPTLRHRVILRPEAEIEGLTADNVLSSVLDTVEVPR